MLNRNSKRFLRFLRKNTPDYEGRVYTYDWIEEHYDQEIESVFATVRFLEEQRYLDIASYQPHDIHFGVILTELGMHPYEFDIVAIKSFLFKSIFTPVIVSFLTTVLTLWLKSL